MVLIWTTQSPMGNANARETLETALAFAAYDQPVALLASGLAVNQFTAKPNAPIAGSKDISKLVKALPMYDVEQLYLCEQSVQQFGLNQSELVSAARLVTAEQIAALLQEANHVIRI